MNAHVVLRSNSYVVCASSMCDLVKMIIYLFACMVSPRTSATSPEQTVLTLSLTMALLPQPSSPTNITGLP